LKARRNALIACGHPLSITFSAVQRCVATAIALALLGGCEILAGMADGAVRRAESERRANAFVYDGKTYETREDAEAAVKQGLSSSLKQVEPLRDPLPIAARIIIPNKDAILERQRKFGGPEVNDYRATVMSEHLRAYAIAIGVRNLFSKQEIVETSLPDHAPAMPGVGIVYFYLSPAGEWSSWYYISESVPRTPIISDVPARDTAKRFNSLLLAVETVARQNK
jgi:hypothetical protein